MKETIGVVSEESSQKRVKYTLEPVARLARKSITPLRLDQHLNNMILRGIQETSFNSTLPEIEALEDKTSRPANILQHPLPLHSFLAVIGVGPHTYDSATGKYKLSWRTVRGVHTLATALCITSLTATTIFGLSKYIIVIAPTIPAETARQKHPSDRRSDRGWIPGERPGPGAQYYSGAPPVSTPQQLESPGVAGQPVFLSHVLDGLAERMFLVPHSWLVPQTFTTKLVHLAVCSVALHQFAINKGYVFAFTTHCHLLSTGLVIWNTQLTNALEDVWERGSRGEVLGRLVQRRHHLVRMGDTQQLFSPVLQCILRHHGGNRVHGALPPGQGCRWGVQSGRAGDPGAAHSTDQLAARTRLPRCRHCPGTGELARSLTTSQVYITGGNFFIINRSFILTCPRGRSLAHQPYSGGVHVMPCRLPNNLTLRAPTSSPAHQPHPGST
ncbi:hypothetical protein Hamer_G014150 [Homarus americanus]|uniref:Uncharacterized protein n=1 Tax=Homarus americanus TaxID=6706 RepID=A0A8J5JY88_HOMAM|nr:hypothetical protein Hamer_G014150 [Homarus americanus]